VTRAGLRSAWLGRLDEETQVLRTIATCGADLTPLLQVDASARDGAPLRDLVVSALREARPRVCRDSLQTPDAEDRHTEATSAAAGAFAIFPIVKAGGPRAVLCVHAAEASDVGASQIDLLGSLADDLSSCFDEPARAPDPALRDRDKFEARYRTLFDCAPDGLLIADAQSYYLDANPSMCRMLGYSREELIGLHASDIVAPTEIVHIAPALEVIASKSEYSRLWTFRRKDGSVFPAEVIATTMPDGYLLGMVRDVTERTEKEQALQERQAQLRLASHVARLGAWTVDLPERRIRWSDELIAMCGVAPDTLPSEEATVNFYAPEFRELVQSKAEACMGSGAPFDVEAQVVTAANRRRWVRVIGQAERDAERNIVRMHGTLQDIDEQHTLQEQLRQAQKMEAIGRLAGGVAHDFNNMLSVILSYAELAQQKLLPGSPGHAELGEICRAAERSAELTRDLLAFSRKQIREPRAINMAQTVVGMESMLKRLLGEDVELWFQVRSGSGTVLIDPKQVEQVVMNLSLNARDAMPHGGKLQVEIVNVKLDAGYASHHVEVEPGSYVMLAVTDTGTGMDAATRERIFEPFFTTKEAGKGTGLGLSTVFGIVKQNRGHIWVYSEPGHGTTFKVYLPRIDRPPEELSARVSSPATLRGSETVLLVEDEEQVRRVIAEVLTRYGYHVLVARDVNDACNIASSHAGPIDLLLTDIVMAHMSGRELSDRITSLRPATRVLYVSGYTQGAIVHQGVLEPGIAFLAKPLTPQALCLKVREVLDAPRTA
jgi:PAS domain S-box-containing protein